MHKAETITALVLAFSAAVLLREALRLPIAWTSTGPGAGFFPFWLAVGVAISAAVIVTKSLRSANPGNSKPFIPTGAWKPLMIAFLPMMAIVALIDTLGIYLGGAVYLAGYMRLVGRHRWTQVVLVSVLIPLVLFLIFEKWFLLPMPKGSILEYFLYER